jgi:hypothetical protein
LRIQQPRRIGHELCCSSSAGDFQHALFAGLHDVLVADFSCAIPKLPGLDGIRHDVTDRSAEKITKGRLVYRLLTGTNGKARFAMTARTAGSVPND